MRCFSRSPASLGLLLGVCAALACGSTSDDANIGAAAGPGGGPPLPGESGAPGSAIGTTGLENGGLGTDWHADPDGDGVKTGADKCPYIYDPAQADGNGDGVGDMCDPEIDRPTPGGAIDDLRAEHVTPYGAWLTFRSNETNQYGFRAEIGWSTTRAGVESKAAIEAAMARGEGATLRVNERVGDRIPVPMIVTKLAPDTTYFAAVMDNAGKVGKALTFKTHPAPGVAPAASYPRVYATKALLDELKKRSASKDAAFTTWRDQLAPRLARAIGDGDLEQQKYCHAAAALYHATGDASALAAAKTLHGELLAHWEGSSFGGNEYRWADAALGICTDLLWNELDAATRDRSLEAILKADERATSPENTNFRIDDTDEFHSSVRTWMIDGLLGCKGPGVAAAISDRACKVLDHGLRNLYGVMLVQARRDRGFMAMSGGHMPDSTTYAPGSSLYWTQTLWALSNAGIPASEYAPWVAHNLAATYLHATTPRRKGRATYGDVDKHIDNVDNEPNSVSIDTFHTDLIAMQMGILRAAGRTKEAGWARAFMNATATPDNYQSRFNMLLFDTASLPEVDPRTVLPPSYFDSGFGLLYDRTSWTEAASMLTLRAGWSGVDHSQEEQGHFQLYRKGRWITHESIAYEGPATHVDGHNVIVLGAVQSNGTRRGGQYAFRNNGPARLIRASSGAQHAFAHADITRMHQSGFSGWYPVDAVERALVWLKGDEKGSPDSLVVYDLVDDAEGAAPTGDRLSQLHFDAAPTLDGRHASLELDGPAGRQKIDLTVVLPGTASLLKIAPDGQPGNSTDAIYTHRVVIDPKLADRNLRIVSVLQAADVGGAAAPAASAIAAGDFVGAAIGSTAVLFRKAPLGSSAPKPSPATVTLTSPAQRVYWTGHVAAADYTVKAAGTTFSATPGPGLKADRGGALIFDVSASGAITPVYK